MRLIIYVKSVLRGYPVCSASVQLVLALVLVFGSIEVVSAQITAQQLLAPAVDNYGPEYGDVENAINVFKKGETKTARKILQEAKAKHPELAPADVMMALLYLSINHRSHAEDAIDDAVVNEPNDPGAFVLLAELALRERRRAVAELGYQHAKSLVERQSDNSRRLLDLKIRIWAGLASLNESRGQYDLAVEQLNEWISLDPKNPVPLGSLGRVNFQRKKYDEAIRAFGKLTEVDKDAPPVAIAMGRLYSDAGMQKLARESMAMAVKQNGKDIRTRLTVAEWALSAGLIDMATENVAAALKIDKDSSGGQVLASRLARQSGKLQEAEKILSEAVLRSPNSFSVTNELARTIAVSSDEKKRKAGLQYARRNFQIQRNRKTPAGLEAVVTYAWLLFQNGRSAEAEAALNALPNGSTVSNENAFYAAKIYSDRKKPDLAIGALRAALSRDVAFPGRDEAQKLLDKLTNQVGKG